MARFDEEADPFDDEEEELPVIPAPGTAPPEPLAARERRPQRTEHKGNTPTTMAAERRREVTREAQGRAHNEPDEWRQAHAAGESSKARAALSSRTPTHNANSGFGLASS